MTTAGISEDRRRVLERFGAGGPVADELLQLNSNPIAEERFAALPELPLHDEAHVAAWREYSFDAVDDGVWPALRRRLVQLQFPIRDGMSEDETYRSATRRGIFPDPPPAEDLNLEAPDGLELQLHQSLAGTVPVLVPAVRADFEALVRAITARNEPRPVPPSMGACMVAGFNNWDRVHAYRRSWEAEDPSRGSPGAWSAEFRRLIPQRELYQDRFIILSRGPYSDVAAHDIGQPEAGWRDASLRIRREHECTHHFTLRVFGKLQHNLLEELIADYVGLAVGDGAYDPSLALRFLGLEAYPTYRHGGRLENYLGDPPLSGDAFRIATALVHAAAHNLAAVHQRFSDTLATPRGQARLVTVLTSLTLEQMADENAVERAADRMTELFG